MVSITAWRTINLGRSPSAMAGARRMSAVQTDQSSITVERARELGAVCLFGSTGCANPSGASRSWSRRHGSHKAEISGDALARPLNVAVVQRCGLRAPQRAVRRARRLAAQWATRRAQAYSAQCEQASGERRYASRAQLMGLRVSTVLSARPCAWVEGCRESVRHACVCLRVFAWMCACTRTGVCAV